MEKSIVFISLLCTAGNKYYFYSFLLYYYIIIIILLYYNYYIIQHKTKSKEAHTLFMDVNNGVMKGHLSEFF